MRAECPKTCTNPNGFDCGEVHPADGCFCKEDFVLDSNGDCIHIEDCGCKMPDNSTTLRVIKNYKYSKINKCVL